MLNASFTFLFFLGLFRHYSIVFEWPASSLRRRLPRDELPPHPDPLPRRERERCHLAARCGESSGLKNPMRTAAWGFSSIQERASATCPSIFRCHSRYQNNLQRYSGSCILLSPFSDYSSSPKCFPPFCSTSTISDKSLRSGGSLRYIRASRCNLRYRRHC